MFRLSIVTPQQPFYEGDCSSLTLPGSEGYLGVLSNHAPLITAITPGRLAFTESDGDTARQFAISGGFFEVSHNKATVLAVSIEEPGSIDIGRAEEALARARKRLAERPESLDAVRAEKAIWRAVNRLDIVRRR